MFCCYFWCPIFLLLWFILVLKIIYHFKNKLGRGPRWWIRRSSLYMPLSLRGLKVVSGHPSSDHSSKREHCASKERWQKTPKVRERGERQPVLQFAGTQWRRVHTWGRDRRENPRTQHFSHCLSLVIAIWAARGTLHFRKPQDWHKELTGDCAAALLRRESTAGTHWLTKPWALWLVPF